MAEVTELLLYPDKTRKRLEHNKNAARLRYRKAIMETIFKDILTEISKSK